MFADDAYEVEQPAQDVDMQLEPEQDPGAPITTADAWVVIESYFQQHNLVSQQIDSFNHFINNRLQVCSPRCQLFHARPIMMLNCAARKWPLSEANVTIQAHMRMPGEKMLPVQVLSHGLCDNPPCGLCC